jgi:hypothetical protein
MTAPQIHVPPKIAIMKMYEYRARWFSVNRCQSRNVPKNKFAVICPRAEIRDARARARTLKYSVR